MKIAICDDNKVDRDKICDMLSNNFEQRFANNIYLLDSSSSLLRDIENTFYDIVFLDVDMPEMSGIEVGNLICEKHPETFIVFVTNYPQYAIDAYDCHAFHYLLKPLEIKRMQKVINNLLQKLKERHKYINIKIKTETIRIPIKEIYYVEYCRRHVIYHLKDKKYETVGKFGDVYEELKDFGFYQIHQGYIVNMEKVVEFDKFTVLLEDGKSVMMSTRKRTEVIMAYAKYIEVRK